MSLRPFLFCGGPGLLGNTVFREFLTCQADIALGPEIDLLRFIPGTHSEILKAEVYLKEFLLAPQDFDEIFAQMISQVLDGVPDAEQMRWIAEVSPFNSLCMDGLHSLFPDSMMIFVVQDARAVISARLEKEEPGEKERRVRLYELAHDWVRAAEGGIQSMTSSVVASRSGMLRLEDLIMNPSQTAQTLRQHLGLTISGFDEARFADFLEKQKACNGMGDWRQKLDLDDLKILNHVCGAKLRELNYFGL